MREKNAVVKLGIDFHILEYIFCIATYFILIESIQTCMDQVEFNLKLSNLGILEIDNCF